MKTYIILRQGAIRWEIWVELLWPTEAVSSLDPFRASSGRPGVLLPGNQYAEIPVSNQSQTLKLSPFGRPEAPGLWKCNKKFRTWTKVAISDRDPRKLKVTLLSCGIFQQSPVIDVHSNLRATSSGDSGPSSRGKFAPYRVLQAGTALSLYLIRASWRIGPILDFIENDESGLTRVGRSDKTSLVFWSF
jgi:hypothetical protein